MKAILMLVSALVPTMIGLSVNGGTVPPHDRVSGARVKAEARIERRKAALNIYDRTAQLREVRGIATRNAVIFRYQQVHHGVPVYGAQLTVSIWTEGESEQNGLVLPLDVSTVPEFTAADAERLARKHVGFKGAVRGPETTLIILPRSSLGDVPRHDSLAWRVEMAASNEEDGLAAKAVYVDAHYGTVVAVISELPHATYVAPQRYCEGNWARGSCFVVGELSNNGSTVTTQYVQDPCYGTGVSPHDSSGQLKCWTTDPATQRTVANGRGNWVGNANGRMTTNPKIMTMTGTVLGNGVLGSSNALTVAADAHFYVYWTFRYLQLTHTRNGLDHAFGPVVRTIVRHPSWPSQWFAQDRAVILSSPTPDHYDCASGDIIAHELGHALDDYGPNFLIAENAESTKLMESTANMFAMLVSKTSNDPVPYWIGENIMRSGIGALTYMDDPARKQGTVACYSPDIKTLESHRGAGPGDHMFYLLVYGGTSKCNGNVVSGIGFEAAETIWYQAFQSLTSNSTYADLRQAFVAAAAAYSPGPTEVLAATNAAFDAVAIP